jgi:hypothetical protein
MADWPALPRPGETVRLPLPLPPMLLEALGYRNGDRYVALRWWGGSGGDPLMSDAAMSEPGWWPAWRLLVREHPLGRAIFAGYDLGDLAEDPAEQAPHWLLCDRWGKTLEVGLARDVEQLLRTQPSELHAAARELGHLPVVAELLERWAPPPANAVEAELRRKHELLDELRGWLDRLQQEVEQGGATR